MKLLLPCDTDIILGGGGIGRYHAGNKWFRRQLEPHKINYQQIEGRADKRTFLTSILQEIIASGRCFYKKESPNKYCIVGLEDRFHDGHLILEHKVRNLLSARARAATTTMSTKQRKLSEATASKVGEEEDLGALIYRESQLRKREAATAAAVEKSERNAAASTRLATSTRRAATVAAIRVDDDSSTLASDRKVVAKGKRRSSVDNDEGEKAAKKVDWKKYRYECSADGCTNQAKVGGVCVSNPHDESTAFTLHGSKYDETTVTLPNQRTAAASTNQEQSRNPPSVIFCPVTNYVDV